MSDVDTIAAISTPLGEGGIGIVRISGLEAYSIANRIFDCPKSDQVSYPEARRLYYGHIIDPNRVIMDEALVAYMPAPYTFTREDVVEINCHSGVLLLRAVLKLVLKEGARLAQPGEFTRRALINGRIDLAQAEAVMNIISARSEEAVKRAALNLQGEITNKIESIRSTIIEIRAPLEAGFDYPEEFTPNPDETESLRTDIIALRDSLQRLLLGVERNRACQEGIAVAIIGRPNVGKSSLLNALLRQQRAIVHELPGTTRDLMEGYINIGGYPLRIIDTAGIQPTEDPVEEIGIERSRAAAVQARMILVVLDGSVPLDDLDRKILELRQPNQALLVIINKTDLKQKLSRGDVKKACHGIDIIETVAIEEKGISQLEEAVVRELDQVLGSGEENPGLVSERQEAIIGQTLQHIERALELANSQPAELVSLELREAWLKLGEISGDTAGEGLLDEIFSRFCLGK